MYCARLQCILQGVGYRLSRGNRLENVSKHPGQRTQSLNRQVQEKSNESDSGTCD